MPVPSSPLFLQATTPVVASKSCSGTVNSWYPGTNRLTWNSWDRSDFDYAALYLQRSTVDNHRPVPALTIRAPVDAGPPSDSFWSTIKTWSNGEILPGSEPNTWDDTNVPHSTFYYYRLILQLKVTGTSPPYIELDWNVATIVQPFDLSICTTDSCGALPQDCRTLLWDAPVLTVPYITGAHVACAAPQGCYRIHVNWTYTPTPTSYDIYKSNVGPNTLGLVANTATSPLNGNNDWYDSDLSDRTMWYQFRAIRPNGSVINSNIVQISY